MKLKLIIATPYGEKYNGDIDEITVPGIIGEMNILPQHASLITALDIGEMKVLASGKKTYYAINKGYLEVSENTVRITTETCEEASEIDVHRAKKSLESARKKLESTDPFDTSVIKTLNARIKRAETRIRVASYLTKNK